ncbi:chemotaxis protein [Sulfurimonas sp. C5]|uniref:chemotaxis protein n=1 Tax=Sulfurimonas sp. C5 TaxID=3036947 RepID=UPI0024543292|nr:chemotaxis protein [Sulfurimonas sp. C5]MDH4944551.1 chemotaxis protein [Sulfurimonas sp. C5]
MTQEELDALMGGELDLDDIEEEELAEEIETDIETATQSDENNETKDDREPPKWGPPATHENKVVHQLDDVTKESEEKASEIFDIIENISNDLMDKEENLNNVVALLESNVALFTTLREKFPDVNAFANQLEKNEEALASTQDVIEALQNSGDSIMNVMDIMQYQDIHRQKIERVINVMRTLSKYMNSLFESQVDDSSRVSSAKHIEGDENSDLASTEDIEALLEQFGK